MAPIVCVSVFKWFLSRAYKICPERYIDEEIQFLIGVFKRMVMKEKLWKRLQKII